MIVKVPAFYVIGENCQTERSTRFCVGSTPRSAIGFDLLHFAVPDSACMFFVLDHK